jgi:hypothetical protein
VRSSQLFTQFYGLSKDDASKLYIVCCNSVGENPGAIGAVIYPNPFPDIVHIEFEKPGDYKIRVADLPGITQIMKKVTGTTAVSLNLGSLSDGTYILHIEDIQEQKHTFMKINKIKR